MPRLKLRIQYSCLNKVQIFGFRNQPRNQELIHIITKMAAETPNRLLALLQEAQSEIQQEIQRRTSGPQSLSSASSSSSFASSLSSVNLTPSPTSVLAELRSRIQPYSTAPNQRFRVAGRSAGRRSIAAAPRTWSNKFFCLGGPTETKTPTSSQRFILAEQDLGEKIVTADTDGSSDALIHRITEQFTKLQGFSFELMRCVGTGGYGKPLIRVSSNNPVPDVQYLKVSRISTIFIRPLTEIVQLEPLYVVEDEGASVRHFELHPPAADCRAGTSSASTFQNTLPETNFTDDEELEDAEVPTMLDFRRRVIARNPGLQCVYIARDNYLERLFGVYKYPNVNLEKELRVEFIGEAGTDYGALTREFFWNGLLEITRGRLEGKSLFEGVQDHLLPATNSTLLRTGVFDFLGKFIAHAAIHTGIGFIGLIEAVVEYLTLEDVNSDTPISITPDDVPDHDYQISIANVRKLQDGANLSHEEAVGIQELALSSDFLDRVTVENAKAAVDQILYHQVIERRKPYLDAIKRGLGVTRLLPFLQKHSYLSSAVFPREKDVRYPCIVVMDRITYKGDPTVIGYIKDYLSSLTEEKMSPLIEAWTGWPILPEGPLKVTVERDCSFEAHTCFEEIFVPENFTPADVKLSFDLLIQNPQGFGRV